MVPEPRRVMVAFRIPEALRDVLQGVSDFVKQHHRRWELVCVDADEFDSAFSGRNLHGALTVMVRQSHRMLRRVRSGGIPVVNMLHDVTPHLPSVLTDDPAAGRAGAEYFAGRGFRSVAFLGIDTVWSIDRGAGFAAASRAAGTEPVPGPPLLDVADLRYLSGSRARQVLRKWARSLPDRTGVMTACDFVSRAMLDACAAEGINVPGRVAILGVDNFHTICELAPVSLSSVAQDFVRLGHEAARVLDGLMDGAASAFTAAAALAPVLVPPGRLHARASTDVLAYDDPAVAAALHIIHERAAAGVSVKELLREIPLSRKWLDQRFKAAVGHTPSVEIRRCRLRHVRDLLLETDLTVQQIAARCGYSCAENLVRAFRDLFALPPQAYRRQHR